MPRPKKTDDERRDRLGQFRMTAAEELTAKMNAAAAGISPAEYYRRRSLGQSVTPPVPKADRQLLAELNSIGNNVNQIARDVNSGREYRGDVQAVMDELTRLIDKVVQLYDL